MWNQWSVGPTPLPTNSLVNTAPLIGPVQPAPAPSIAPAPTFSSVQTMQTSMYHTSTGAPSYTPAQFAAMTPDQQYAVQQHWQQWQAYEQQYAQWHAQYGEQYKREMEAMHGASTQAAPSYSSGAPAVASSFNFPPPNIVNAFPKHQPSTHAPPPPPPEEASIFSGVKAPPHIYEQPPPPPPPPQTEEKQDGKSDLSLPSHGNYSNAEFVQNSDIRWSQPPPNILNMEGNRWSEPGNFTEHSKMNQSIQSNQQQRFKNSNKNEIQYGTQKSDDIGCESKKHYRHREQGKIGKNFDNSRRQQLEDTSGVNNQVEKNNVNNRPALNSNRFSHSDFQTNSGVPKWNQDNTTEQGDVKTLNSQTAKTGNSSIDEKNFDEQFRLWEEQFENWKKENANHPDRRMYMQYEREFEKTRIHLLERREQMRRRKILENQLKHPQVVPKEKTGNLYEISSQSLMLINKPVGIHKKHSAEPKVEQNEVASKQVESEKSHVAEHDSNVPTSSEKSGGENNVFKNKEITELFKSDSGIPGLDLVEGKHGESIFNPNDSAVVPEVIDLDRDNEGDLRSTQISQAPIKFGTPTLSYKQNPLKPLLNDSLTCEQAGLFKKKIPSLLDIVVEKPYLSPKMEIEYQPLSRDQSPVIKSTKSADSRSRSISRDRDLLSPSQKSVSSVNKRQTFLINAPERCNESSRNPLIESHCTQEQCSVPQNVTEIAKVLQDPNVMQLLTVALAQAQQPGSMTQSSTSQQSQLLQQLQQLQPLIQLQQDRNRLPQMWSNQQSQQQNAWQNQGSTININPKSSSNEKSFLWSNNPFNRNADQKTMNRGFGSGNESDGNNDIQQRNPRNPFRRTVDAFNGDTNISGNQSFESNISQCSFEGTYAQQNRGVNSSGGGRFDNRPHSNRAMSIGFRNNQNNFVDRGGDDECYRPAQVFEYQNRSRTDAIVPPTKIVDYGHRPSPVVSANCFNRDSSEFIPVKTIDYGHASSSAQVKNQFSKNISYNDKNLNFEQHQTQISSQRQMFVLKKEKNNENPLNTIQIKSEDQTLQQSTGNDKDGIDTKSKRNIELKKDTEVETEYPKNKWVLQNPETRKRPGPPTKRGKRDNNHIVNKEKHVSPYNQANYDEIEENFEEISDNEELNETDDITKKQEKVKIRPLFPSVTDSITSTAIVFPSIENNNTIPIDEILFKPGRLTRPKNIVIIIRGPPGSGKSHVAKLIKDKEVEMGGPTPRLLSIDDYFMIENDYVEKCPKSGRKIPKKEILYEYEKEMEDTYMQYLIKSFKKTISDHLFDFIIVDCCNQSLRTFNEFYNAARDGNFSPFVVDMKCEIEKCLNQNIHNRSEDDIKNIIKNYQDCPGHYIKLDVSNLLENIVEMEDVSDLEDNFVADSEPNAVDEDEEGDDINDGGFLKSKWDTDPTTENLARLDGTSKPISKRGTATLEEYLQIDGWEPPPSSSNGKKRVRWADIEEKRAQEKMRAIGFVVGQTDWSRMMDPTSGSGALTKTKYIERLNRRR